MTTEVLKRSVFANGARHDETLAVLGGERAVTNSSKEIFAWPIVTAEDETAVLAVLRRGAMSGVDVTRQFEEEFAAWQGTKYALGHNNGTAALHAAMFGCGLGVGDEIIAPSLTYWASALQCLSLGATMVFAEVEESTLCLDPNDIEHRITPRTKAIMVVHYCAHPADMDPIMEIARRHNLKVIEDVSHAQGGYYKGRKLGSIGDVGAMSLMAGKSFAIGEAGVLVTDNREIYERAVAFGHYERFSGDIQTPELQPFQGLPMGGYKYRMHQLSSAMGRVQLKYYDERCGEIERAMNYFWSLLEDVPGLAPHRTTQGGCTMSGWYNPLAHYNPEELGGLSVARFSEAVRAEGSICLAGCNAPLHTHPLLNECDVYGHGKPTRLAHSARDLRQPAGSLPVTERINDRVCTVPWFKHYEPALIEQHAAAFRKVAGQYEQLLESDCGNAGQIGRFGLSAR